MHFPAHLRRSKHGILHVRLPLVALDAHQSAIIAAVRDSQGSATASIEASPSVALLPRPLSPLKQITGSPSRACIWSAASSSTN